MTDPNVRVVALQRGHPDPGYVDKLLPNSITYMFFASLRIHFSSRQKTVALCHHEVGVPEISMPHDVLASLVQQLLNSAPGLGLYGIIPACANLQLRHDGSFKQVLEEMLQPEVRCALAAIALELYGHNVPGYTQKMATVDRDILHTSALSSIPNIASRSNQPTLSNALCLLMLSHTWTIAEDFKKIPMQWCSVARIIFDNCEKEDQRTSLYSRELERRQQLRENMAAFSPLHGHATIYNRRGMAFTEPFIEFRAE
ncbi:hypothetical protein N7490_004733 [Penicillium lividum]|nr:hypothetical protein N7490_004733 [Penicillium lividum]